MLRLNELAPDHGARKKKTRVGRGHASGLGQQAGRGHKGQGSRSNGGVPYQGHEGGQNPLYKRSPKLKGLKFKPAVLKGFAEVNVADLAELKEKNVTLKVLQDARIIRRSSKYLKVLGDGELKGAFTVTANEFSKSAIAKIEKAGGKAEVIKLAKGK